MSYMQTANGFEGVGIQELSFDEIETVAGGPVGCLAIAAGVLIVGALLAIGALAEHNRDNQDTKETSE